MLRDLPTLNIEERAHPVVDMVKSRIDTSKQTNQ